MATEQLNDPKFGLPKPDFQELPVKGTIKKFIFFAIALGALITISIILSHVYGVMQPHIKATASQTMTASMGSKKRVHTVLSSTTTETIARDYNALEVDDAVSDGEAFETVKQIIKKESITEVQKQLEAKRKPKPLIAPGSYQELCTPQGIYHLVIMSYLDKKFALQTVQQLIKKNLGVCLIFPSAEEKYYRVTIGHSRTQYEAEQKLKEFKPTYKDIFIIKY